MHRLNLILFSVLFMLIPAFIMAQPSGPVEMADGLRSSGKIYVVVAVIVTLFTGLVIYIISIDRKITKLEKESNQNLR